ncbi:MULTISPECIES: DinB family protein [unclassified Nocardioides]|uniref:DinB family protein n=1 Tax=unclassified Nocardioides TaxID=2615069 RepID=UPI00360AD129
MSTSQEPKAALEHYLQGAREALLWKVEGLSEHELRRPRTPTGTNLLGIVKHCLNVEVGYFGPTFGREWPTPGELVPEDAYDTDPQADWYATADESAAGLVDLYRRVWSFADATIDELPLETVGRVPWWPADRAEVTLHRVIVHVTADLARHAGHADILREQIDGSVGLRIENSNIPEGWDWPAYVTKLERLAEDTAPRGPGAAGGTYRVRSRRR